MNTKTVPIKLSVLLLALALLAGTTACQANDAEPTPSYDTVTYGDLEETSPRNQVVVLWYPDDWPAETLLELIDEFNAGNEWNITVLGEPGGSTGDIHRRIVVRIAEQQGGGPRALPQMVAVERYQAAVYAGEGVLVEPAPFAESERWGLQQEEAEDLVTPAAGPSASASRRWSIGEHVAVLYYNVGWLAEMGRTEPPTTWDEFTEIACAASDAEAGLYGYEFSADAITFAGLLANRGGELSDEEEQTYGFDGETGLELVTSIQNLIVRGCAVLKTEPAGDRLDFGAGKVLFAVGSTAEMSRYRRSVAEGAGFDWSVAPLPTTLEEPRTLVHGPRAAILPSTPEKQLASWLFLRWLAEPEQQIRWSHAANTLPVRASTAELLQYTYTDGPQLGKASGFLAYEAVFEPDLAGYGDCRSLINEMLVAVGNLADARTWLANTAAACNETLED